MDHTTRRNGAFAAVATVSLSLFVLSAACGRPEEPEQPGERDETPKAPAQPAPQTSMPAQDQPGAPPGGAAGSSPVPGQGDAGDIFEVLPRERDEPKQADPIMNTRYSFQKGLRFTIPRGWVVEAPANSMRLAQYRIPAPKDSGQADGLVIVSGGIGGSVDDNLRRWAAQMKDGTKKPTRQEVIVGDLIVSQLVATGTYDGSMPMAGGPPSEPQRNAMMLGAIIDNGPEGLVFIKATGPEAVLGGQRGAWDMLVRSVVAIPDPRARGGQR